jgi:hypothetical protein
MSETIKARTDLIEELKYLDSLAAYQRWHRLKSMDDNHVLALYIACVNGYGSESPVGQDLLRAVGKWIDRQRPRRLRKWLQIQNEEHVVNQSTSSAP